MASEKVVFIGGGQMAQALAGGAIAAELLHSNDISFVEPNGEQVKVLQAVFPGCAVFNAMQDALHQADLVILSVKPHVLKEISDQLSQLLEARHLVVSIAAGVSLETLQSILKTGRVVRVMPNTPALVGAGASAISADAQIDDSDISRVQTLLEAVGTVVRVPDSLMHAVTGLSGSGPAYIYVMIEALSDGGVAQGLPREVATRLAAQTVLGAAKMVLDSGKHPGQLKDQVTSPGGTTIAAIRTLEKAGVRSAFIEAVASASERSSQLQ